VNETERQLLQIFDELEQKAIDLHAFFELVGRKTAAGQQAVLAAIERLLGQGLLEERGGDFYARTEAGIRAAREKSIQE
jgi:hypothetical protein